RTRASPCRGRGRGFPSRRVWSADVLCRCADVLGQRPAHDPQACSQEVILAEPERELTRAAEKAHARGAFGVPTFFCDGRMFWGRQREPITRSPVAALPS